jgi:hypothetical protein
MRMHPVALRFVLSVVGGVAVGTPAFSQEYRGTFEQQMACTPDVFRLCGEQIPDTNRIVACLRQNTALLSTPCRAVFETNASVAQREAPRRRNVQPRPDVQATPDFQPNPGYAQPGYAAPGPVYGGDQ